MLPKKDTCARAGEASMGTFKLPFFKLCVYIIQLLYIFYISLKYLFKKQLICFSWAQHYFSSQACKHYHSPSRKVLFVAPTVPGAPAARLIYLFNSVTDIFWCKTKDVRLHHDKCAILKIFVNKNMSGLLNGRLGRRTHTVFGRGIVGGHPIPDLAPGSLKKMWSLWSTWFPAWGTQLAAEWLRMGSGARLLAMELCSKIPSPPWDSADSTVEWW